ncbi:glycosyl hydrolase [Aspergillus floccosus]
MASFKILTAPAVLWLASLLAQLASVKADNPIVQDIYTTDPAPFVYNDRIYLLTGHDEDGSTTYDMRDWRLFSSADVANWQHHGVPMSLSTFQWADLNAWAGQIVPRNNKFYAYVPIRHASTGGMAIGVAVSDNITGPYADAIGKPLVENAEIDPTVYIDDDGQAYMYWGNPGLWYVTLNEDMISYSGSINKVDLTVEGFGPRRGESNRPTAYEEGPWLYKRRDIYYMVYAANCCSEDIRYATAPSATGPWTYKGIVMPTQGASFTNHPGVIDFKNNSYFFYHNGALPGGSGYTRSVSVESFVYNSDGTIPEMDMTTEGPKQIGTLDPYVVQEAETIAWSEGIETEVCSEGGLNVGYINNGDYIKVKGVAFGTGAAKFTARVASNTAGGTIELHIDSQTGTVIGSCKVSNTGGWQSWASVECPISDSEGTHDLFLKFVGDGTGFLFNFNWWQFSR